jgi:hypothetical protein
MKVKDRSIILLLAQASLSRGFITHHHGHRSSVVQSFLSTCEVLRKTRSLQRVKSNDTGPVCARNKLISPPSYVSSTWTQLSAYSKVDDDDAEISPWGIDPFFGSLLLALLAYAFAAPGVFNSPQDQALLDNYIANPTDPEGFNLLYLTIFDLLGIIPVIAASVALPQGSKKGLPAAPFLAASAALGFFGAGPYFCFRAPPRTEIFNLQDQSWFTRNVIENKVFNWAVVAFVVFTLYSTGFLTALLSGGLDLVWTDFIYAASNSKFISISCADAFIYNIAIARLITRDYQLRVVRQPDNNAAQDDTTAISHLVSASTLLLPFLGPALYCAWRPKLRNNE